MSVYSRELPIPAHIKFLVGYALFGARSVDTQEVNNASIHHHNHVYIQIDISLSRELAATP